MSTEANCDHTGTGFEGQNAHLDVVPYTRPSDLGYRNRVRVQGLLARYAIQRLALLRFVDRIPDTTFRSKEELERHCSIKVVADGGSK
jgi:hypothetical protein